MDLPVDRLAEILLTANYEHEYGNECDRVSMVVAVY